ncbi:MAG: glucose-1-phosphate thymidylyltransferase RfbA [Clostridia bacterium]|nr:glucose-1-phosphate thymidylyltransferase RfbA [Clostridia bacterium]
MRKGIILAGGKGTRLYPITKSVSKQLLPIYDKPMIYYPLSVLLLAGIRDILIISTPEALPQYESLLGDGSRLGVHFSYIEQEKPRGLAEAFILGEEFIGKDDVCLVLGDNFFHGQSFGGLLKAAMESKTATIFGYLVKDPRQFGVVEFDKDNNVISIEEKPENPKSNFIIPGLYFYDNKVIEIAKSIGKSPRGELEITDVNKKYLEMSELKVIQMGRGLVWMDTGTPRGMLKTAQYVESIQSRQGWYIACIEEIAWRNGFISTEEFIERGKEIADTEYGKYILDIAQMGGISL